MANGQTMNTVTVGAADYDFVTPVVGGNLPTGANFTITARAPTNGNHATDYRVMVMGMDDPHDGNPPAVYFLGFALATNEHNTVGTHSEYDFVVNIPTWAATLDGTIHFARKTPMGGGPDKWKNKRSQDVKFT